MSNLRQEIEKRRTFAIISHPDAGKTTLTENLLYLNDQIKEMGRVDNGNTVTDDLRVEKSRGK